MSRRILSAEVKAAGAVTPFQLGTFELVLRPKDGGTLRHPLRLQEVMWFMDPTPTTRKLGYVFAPQLSSSDSFKMRPRISFQFSSNGSGTLEVRHAKAGKNEDLDSELSRASKAQGLTVNYSRREFAALQRDFMLGFPAYTGLHEPMGAEAWREVKQAMAQSEEVQAPEDEELVVDSDEEEEHLTEEGENEERRQ